MEQVNSQALLNLASSKIQQATIALGGAAVGSTDVQASLRRQAAERYQENIDVAASEILKVKQNLQEFLTAQATTLVSLENQIANIKALAAKANLANAYGDATDNYLPLQKMLTGSVPSTDKALVEMPKDWVAPTGTPAAE